MVLRHRFQAAWAQRIAQAEIQMPSNSVPKLQPGLVQYPRCRRVDPKALTLKGIGWQRNSLAVFVSVEPIPRNRDSVQPQRAKSKQQVSHSALLSAVSGEREWQCMEDRSELLASQRAHRGPRAALKEKVVSLLLEMMNRLSKLHVERA